MTLRPTTTRLAPIAARALLVACSDNDTGTGSTSLSMAPCTDAPALDCGAMDVPLIHDVTDQRRMLVDVVVLPGTGDSPHGPLLPNPGGPGGSGTELVHEFAVQDALPAALRERHDIVGFDPTAPNAAFVSRLEGIIDTGDELAFELFGTPLLESAESPDFGAFTTPVLIDYARTG